MSGLVSIIMPCYNGEKTISKSIKSILNQTYSNFELIIVNDDSNDKTSEVLREFTSQNIKLIVQNNKFNLGVAKSRNKAIKVASGDFIAFCDSDDFWEKNKLANQVKLLERYDVVCSNYNLIDEESNLIKHVIESEIITFKKMLNSNKIPNSSGIYNSKKLGKFYQKNIRHEDYLMWLQIIQKAKIGYRIQDCLMSYTVSTNNLTSNKFKSLKWTFSIYYNELKLGFFNSLFRILIYSYINFKKHIL